MVIFHIVMLCYVSLPEGRSLFDDTEVEIPHFDSWPSPHRPLAPRQSHAIFFHASALLSEDR